MTLLIDATTAEHATGIGIVIRGVLSHALGVQPDGMVVTAGPTTRIPEGLAVRRVGVARSRPGRLLYQRVLLPFEASSPIRTTRVDRILALDSYAPLITIGDHVRYAALVHDVLPLTHPEYWTVPQLLTKRLAFGSIRRAHATVFASTEYTAVEVGRLLGITPRIVHFGCGQLTDLDADAARTAPLPQRKAYLLYVGAIEPRKGSLALIDIFDYAVSHSTADLELILVGTGQTDYARRLQARIAASPNRDRIRLIGNASRDEALMLFRHATALVVPSAAEGFGLPILEALALGTPVIATRLDSIRSWAGNMALYANLQRSQEWSDRIQEAAGFSSARRRAGQEFAAAYRWRECASRLLSF